MDELCSYFTINIKCFYLKQLNLFYIQVSKEQVPMNASTGAPTGRLEKIGVRTENINILTIRLPSLSPSTVILAIYPSLWVYIYLHVQEFILIIFFFSSVFLQLFSGLSKGQTERSANYDCKWRRSGTKSQACSFHI